MIELEGGKKIFQEMSAGWDRNLSSFKVNRCMYCHDLTAELADISFGDAWLPEVVENDSVGSNLIIARSDFGEETLAQMNASEIIWSTPIEKGRVAESQNYCNWKKTAISGRIKLAQMLSKEVPDFGQTRFPSPSLISVRNAAIQHFQMMLASRKALWWLLRLLNRVIDVAEHFNLVCIPHSEKEMSGKPQ
jgi:coenzyme F420 hydrogenase subunit beta